MSRIGQKPVVLKPGVELSVDNSVVTVKGAKTSMTYQLPENVTLSQEEGQVTLSNDSQLTRALWGTARSNIENMVQGASEGFTIKLEISGVGYKAAIKGSELELALGFSHPVLFKIPEGITIVCPKPTEIEISGANKQRVGQVAANIRKYRKPEPYKGKGIKYEGEQIRRKEGKKK